MIENISDLAAAAALVLASIAGILLFYNTLVSHREVYMQKREALYYRLFEEQDEDDFDDRNEPYYED